KSPSRLSPCVPLPASPTPSMPRTRTLLNIASRNSEANPESNGASPALPTSDYFGVNTFSVREMRERLPNGVFNKLLDAIRLGQKLDPEVAPVVAQAIKEWAMARGATHFCHWFQPMTGLTAEKHDAFLTFD